VTDILLLGIFVALVICAVVQSIALWVFLERVPDLLTTPSEPINMVSDGYEINRGRLVEIPKTRKTPKYHDDAWAYANEREENG